MSEFPIWIPGVSPETASRFHEKVSHGDDCWEWTGSTSRGYGYFRYDGKPRVVHRWLFEKINGPLPASEHVDHICRNRRCVRPGHLRAVTRSENNQNLPNRRSNNASGARGVYWHAKNQKWIAAVRKDGRSHYLGSFSDLSEARDAAATARRDLFTHSEMDKIGGTRV